MPTTEQFRATAAGYAELAETATSAEQAREFHKRNHDLTRLADNEQWMADNHDKTVHARDNDTSSAPEHSGAGHALLAVDEERILRCLGAALILQWNTLPTNLQKKLFDSAGTAVDLANTGTLRAQIARFLHTHKDGED
jgi:hypothetical protein